MRVGETLPLLVYTNLIFLRSVGWFLAGGAIPVTLIMGIASFFIPLYKFRQIRFTSGHTKSRRHGWERRQNSMKARRFMFTHKI